MPEDMTLGWGSAGAGRHGGPKWVRGRLSCRCVFDKVSLIPNGGGWVPVGSPVFKTGGGPLNGPRWVRLPSIPAYSLAGRRVG